MTQHVRFDEPRLDKLDLVAHARAIVAGTVRMRSDARDEMVRAVGRDYPDNKFLALQFLESKGVQP